MHTRITGRSHLMDLGRDLDPQPLYRWARTGPPNALNGNMGGDREWDDGGFEAEDGAAAAAVPWAMQGFEYVKWLQRALNQVLKLKLPVNGHPDGRTVSAIQKLQRHSQSKLVRIGLVGPWTDRALLKAGAPPTPLLAPPGAVGMDCNFDTRPYLSCIKKATWKGQPIAFVVRYYSGYRRKNLSRGEADALSKLGVRCVTVWEGLARDAIGHDNGRAHGYDAFRQAVQCGQPTGTPIYFAVDYEPSAAERPGVERYFEGVREGLSRVQRDPKLNPNGLRYEVGVYGNRVALDLCKAQGIVTWFWQSCSLLTAGGTNQFRWPGVALHQVACEKPLCPGCGAEQCPKETVDWDESDGHEGGWVVSGAVTSATAPATAALPGLTAVRAHAAASAAIVRGERNENRVTDAVFYALHPERGGRSIARGETRLVQEWLSIRDEVVRPALQRLPSQTPGRRPTSTGTRNRQVAALVPLLDRYRGEVPLVLLLGWIDVESGGDIGASGTKRLDERGYFQISRDESRRPGLNFQHERLSTDSEYSIQAGIQLVRYYAELARQRYPWIPYGSQLFWRIVKYQHAMGSWGVQTLLNDMRDHGIATTWEAIKRYEVTELPRLIPRLSCKPHDPKCTPGRFGMNVDKLFERGREIASSIGRL